jgi:transglutaminase-like putative cysteine protease
MNSDHIYTNIEKSDSQVNTLLARLIGILKASRPVDGWLAAVLFAINLSVVSWSIDKSEWVKTPSLTALMLGSLFVGFIIIRIHTPRILILPIGVICGFLMVLWRLTSIESGPVHVSNIEELLERLNLWYRAAIDGTINIDQLPFAIGIMIVTWCLGYVSAWTYFRCQRFWIVFVLGGAGLLCNLTFLPDTASIHLGIYLLTALILIGRIQSVRRRREWDTLGFSHDTHLGLLAISDTILIGFVILIIAFALPIGKYWPPARNGYETLRSPLLHFEEDFNRLFAGLPARRGLAYRIWGNVMAFQGTINPTDTVAFQVESPIPMYWKARTYNYYTSKGWLSNETILRANNWTPSYSAPLQYSNQIEVTYRLTPGYESSTLFAGGQAVFLDTDYIIETYDSPTFTINLEDPGASDNYTSLPLAIHRTIDELTIFSQRKGNDLNNETIAEILPDNLHLIGTKNNGRTITIAEKIPHWPDVLSVRTDGPKIKPGQEYKGRSSLSLATPEELKGTSGKYPIWATQIYTQLPSDLPERIRGLAIELTVNEGTNYDKVMAIQNYLKSLEYNLSIDPPPFDGDGVDHFLFEQKEGYSEYFGSAMTVLLRSIGIPARLATGYSEGEQIKGTDLYIVSDRDAHAWTEVFFPRYGWIPFEPTPGVAIPPISYSLPEPEIPDPNLLGGQLLFDCEDDDEECEEENTTSVSDANENTNENWIDRLTNASPLVGATLGILVALTSVLCLLWVKYMSSSGNPIKTFKNMTILGRINGVRIKSHQTPFEYQENLQQLILTHSESITAVTDFYVRTTYSAQSFTQDNKEQLVQAWRKLRLPMLFYRLKIGKYD